MKLLLITSRNIYNTNGEIRLIKNRANTLYNQFGIITDFICYHDDDVYNHQQEVINEKFEFHMITYSKKNPVSLFLNKKEVLNLANELISKNDYKAIAISGEVALSFIVELKRKTSVPFIYDIHGATNELIEFKGNSLFETILRKTTFKLFRHNEKKYIKLFDAAFAVTEELKQHVIDNFHAGQLKFFIVPCAKKYDSINLNDYRNNREKNRNKYGISSESILFIYSGGISPWQCIDKTIEIFNYISSRIPNCKLLLLSDQADKINISQPNIIKDELPYDMVDETLCAGDYAFMIREDLVTNHVAFPNKYCEYIASGMRIISSPYLRTVANNIKENSLGYVLKNNEDVDGLFDYINKNEDIDFEQRSKVLKQFQFETTLIPFVDYLKGTSVER